MHQGYPLTPKVARAFCQRCLKAKSPLKHGRSWLVLLLTVHIFSNCFPTMTRAQGSAATTPPKNTTASGASGPAVPISITMHPSMVHVGDDVTLTAGGDAEDLVSCTWYRGSDPTITPIMAYKPPPASAIVKHLAYSGREFVGQDCSLHIAQLMPSDTDVYTIKKNTSTRVTQGNISLDVNDNDQQAKGSGNKGLTSGILGGLVGGSVALAVAMGVLLSYKMIMRKSSAEGAQVAPTPSVHQSNLSATPKKQPSTMAKPPQRGSPKPNVRKETEPRGRGRGRGKPVPSKGPAKK
ncbi:carcinoembryonic antigen-related cell adhesion molecule 4-like [Anolis carolinensis]|uniref:carcinoembryonic antigen-related cell adhesion molecule 4-like n=1 Tax=Anolis carolinensis TaxID=28377 RepID=UPI002F2B7E77